MPFVVRLQREFSKDGLLADHHWYFELVFFCMAERSRRYMYIYIFVLKSGPNAKQNAYTWNIPHFNRVITWISLDIEHLYSSKLRKKKQQAPNNKQQTPSTPWLVGAFISSTKKQLPFVASCTHRSPPRRACQRILPLPRRSLSLRRQRPGLTYQSPKVGPNHYRHPPTPRWDQDECEKRIKQNSLTSTWFNLMEVFVHKNFIPIWICIQLWRRITHGYYKSSCFPSCCHLRSPDY